MMHKQVDLHFDCGFSGFIQRGRLSGLPVALASRPDSSAVFFNTGYVHRPCRHRRCDRGVGNGGSGVLWCVSRQEVGSLKGSIGAGAGDGSVFRLHSPLVLLRWVSTAPRPIHLWVRSSVSAPLPATTLYESQHPATWPPARPSRRIHSHPCRAETGCGSTRCLRR